MGYFRDCQVYTYTDNYDRKIRKECADIDRCDRPMCNECAHHYGKDTDFCEEHDIEFFRLKAERAEQIHKVQLKQTGIDL